MGRHDVRGPDRPTGGRPLRRDDVTCEEMDGEAVLFDPQSGAVHRFNAMTLCVWKLCDGTRGPAHIADGIAANYAIGSREALPHVRRILDGLEERSLFCEGGDEAEPAAGCARTDGPGSEAQHTAGMTPPPEAHRPDSAPIQQRGLTRRQALGGGVAKLVFVAPLIATFCARTAYAEASNPIHPGSPTGLGGCKNIGYSCAYSSDCCLGIGNSRCHLTDFVCCVRTGKEGCVFDEDCCEFPTDTCNAGWCN
ncbi:MAG TPA: PqqD family protein [Phycisphaerae bacterium]|nr:PqqD family protein [Phycisphaerae bacterium]